MLEPGPRESAPGLVGPVWSEEDTERALRGSGRGLPRNAVVFTFFQDKGAVRVKDTCPHAGGGRAEPFP